jgi:hypothetical protein
MLEVRPAARSWASTRPELAHAAYLYGQNPPNSFGAIGRVLRRDRQTISRAVCQNLPESVPGRTALPIYVSKALHIDSLDQFRRHFVLRQVIAHPRFSLRNLEREALKVPFTLSR